jgi:hypothetical protein
VKYALLIVPAEPAPSNALAKPDLRSISAGKRKRPTPKGVDRPYFLEFTNFLCLLELSARRVRLLRKLEKLADERLALSDEQSVIQKTLRRRNCSAKFV